MANVREKKVWVFPLCKTSTTSMTSITSTTFHFLFSNPLCDTIDPLLYQRRMTSKAWNIEPQLKDDIFQQHPDLHPVVLQLLHNRGVTDRVEMDRFLAPDYDRDVHHPDLFTHMPQAVARVFSALSSGEKIRIHGDYDADGICGATVLFTTLRDIVRAWPHDATPCPSEDQIGVFLPDRERDGYGFSVSTMERFAEEGVTLVITVDCGISNKETIDRGKALGVDTIVCDHHAMPPELPTSAILIHPQVPGETYPNKHLCGTGVASKLCWGLYNEARARGAGLPEGVEKWLLDLVAIATVTDVMPLLGENRALEQYGLKVLNKTRRPGLKKLIEVAGANKGPIETWQIGFQIGPRVNAAGRMTHARHAWELLVEEDEITAALQAVGLDSTNRDRQKASDALYREAREQVKDDDHLIVVHGEEWHLGLVGLVAGKLLSDFGRPVFVVARHGDRFTGSGRSVAGFDITEPLRAAEAHLLKFGGHPQACGFTAVGEENFLQAMEIARSMVSERLGKDVLQPSLRVDAELKLNDVSEALASQLESLAPFGEKNPMPTFVSRSVRVVRMMPVGKDGKHLKLSLSDHGGSKTWDAIGFGMGDVLEELEVGAIIDVAYELGVNTWNGYRNVQLRLIDVRL